MRHINKTFRLISYLATLLLLIYFILLEFDLNNTIALLYISSCWFFIYGTRLLSTSTTSQYFKIFIFNNLIILFAGLIMYLGFKSNAGLLILTIANGMLAFIIDFSKIEEK